MLRLDCITTHNRSSRRRYRDAGRSWLSVRTRLDLVSPHAGIYHRVVAAHTPVETLMLRAPSIEDKVYPPDQPSLPTS